MHEDKPHGVEVETSYGKRISCEACQRRWTKILTGDTEPGSLKYEPWVEEKWSSMRESIEEGIRRHEQAKAQGVDRV